jgi:hypothetical protein
MPLAVVVRATEGCARAVLVDASLAATVGPARAVRDRHLVALGRGAPRATAMRPAHAARLAAALAAVDAALDGATVLPAETGVLGTRDAALHGALLAAAVAEAQSSVDDVVVASVDLALAREPLLFLGHAAELLGAGLGGAQRAGLARRVALLLGLGVEQKRHRQLGGGARGLWRYGGGRARARGRAEQEVETRLRLEHGGRVGGAGEGDSHGGRQITNFYGSRTSALDCSSWKMREEPSCGPHVMERRLAESRTQQRACVVHTNRF